MQQLPKYIKKQVVLFMYLITIAGGQALAQQELTLPYMNNVQQAAYLNPTLVPDYKVMIGLPLISSMQFSFSHSGFAANDLFRNDTIDLGKAIAKMGKNNYVHTGANIDLFAATIAVRSYVFRFNVSEKTDLRFTYPRDMFRLIWEGNVPANNSFSNNTVNLDGFSIRATHYREYAIGATKKMAKLTVGGNAKLLFGKSNLSMKQSENSLQTDTADAYAIRVNTNFLLNSSLGTYAISDNGDIQNASGSTTNATTAYLMNTDNKGFAIDLGASYAFSPKFKVTGGINNLGFINWKSNVRNFEGNGTAVFTGIPLTQASQLNTLDKITDAQTVIDTLKSKFDVHKSRDTYTTSLVAQSYLLANYEVASKTTIGAGFFAEYYQGIRPALTVNVHQKIGDILGLMASYSMQNNTYNNIGLGVVAKLSGTQLYMATDNFMALVSPLSTQNFNIRFGMNLVFGKKPTKLPLELVK